ncbi:MAG: ribosomal protein [Oscillospiraceae bacterium]|nr:ribosomal protein [Oscillospiraceae bacterium]
MKASEVRKLSAAELETKLGELKKDLFQLRLQHATNQLENPVRIAEVKKDIARVKTMIREQQLAGR